MPGDKWESRPYVVVKKQPSVPVYVVRVENGDIERVVHRNLLTQCMFLPVDRADETAHEDVEDTVEDIGNEVTEEDEGMEQPEVGSEQAAVGPQEERGETDDADDEVSECSPDTADEEWVRMGTEEKETDGTRGRARGSTCDRQGHQPGSQAGGPEEESTKETLSPQEAGV